MPVDMKEAAAGAAPNPAANPHQKLPSFIKTGDAAQEALKQQEAARAAAQEARDRLWRWGISGKNLNVPYKIIFLDGIVNPKTKMLQNPVWAEHTIKNARGRFDTYMCTDHGMPGAEPCPICANQNADRATTVMGFTIIDPRPVQFTKGDKAGQTLPFSKKLLIVKPKAMPLLQLKANKLGNMRGVCMDVMRTGSTEPSIGNVFDIDCRYSEEELVKTFGVEGAAPANWDHELGYKTAAELVALGVAMPIAGVGGSGPSADYQQQF